MSVKGYRINYYIVIIRTESIFVQMVIIESFMKSTLIALYLSHPLISKFSQQKNVP